MPRQPPLGFSLAAATGFVIRRGFEAPRALVWRAWTDPAHLARWWGPRGYGATVVELDLRPGGRFRIVMRSPEGAEFPATAVYDAVEPPARLAWTEIVGANPAKAAQVTIAFSERDGRTEVTLRTECATEAERDALLALGVERVWGEAFRRLDAWLAAAARTASAIAGSRPRG